jgi:hypothetical protein
MTNHSLRQIVEEILRKEAISLVAFAKKADVGRSNLQFKLNAKQQMDISDTTVNKIRKAFPRYFAETSQKNNNEQSAHHTVSAEPGNFQVSGRELDLIATIKSMADDSVRRADKHADDLKEIILEQLKAMSSQLREISVNSKEILVGVRRQAVFADARSDVALESLARLERKKPDVLKKEASKKSVEILKSSIEHRISDQDGK